MAVKKMRFKCGKCAFTGNSPKAMVAHYKDNPLHSKPYSATRRWAEERGLIPKRKSADQYKRAVATRKRNKEAKDAALKAGAVASTNPVGIGEYRPKRKHTRRFKVVEAAATDVKYCPKCGFHIEPVVVASQMAKQLKES